MNKHHVPQLRQQLKQRPPGLRRPSPAFFLVAGFILTAVFLAVTIVSAQVNSMKLGGGDTVEVLCEGRGFDIERISRQEVVLTCRQGVNAGPPQPQPTSTPAIPTPDPAPTMPPPANTPIPEPTAEPPAPQPPVADACQTVTGWLPLTDLGAGRYLGYEGGLYPGGQNTPPPSYLERAQTAVSRIDHSEPVVFLSIGMSNAMREFDAFVEMAQSSPARHANVHVVNGAQTGQDAAAISDPNADYWNGVDRKISLLRLGPEHVRAVWLKQALAHPDPNLAFPADALQLQAELAQIIDILDQRYPNLEIIYLSSRIYAGYATNDLNPEPFAYQSGFAVKWLIEEQMNDAAYAGPALLWGPYLWADGENPRSDGFTWSCGDYRNDMTHPSEAGMAKVANMLLDFVTQHETAVWFRSP